MGLVLGYCRVSLDVTHRAGGHFPSQSPQWGEISIWATDLYYRQTSAIMFSHLCLQIIVILSGKAQSHWISKGSREHAGFRMFFQLAEDNKSKGEIEIEDSINLCNGRVRRSRREMFPLHPTSWECKEKPGSKDSNDFVIQWNWKSRPEIFHIVCPCSEP